MEELENLITNKKLALALKRKRKKDLEIAVKVYNVKNLNNVKSLEDFEKAIE